MAEIRLEGLNRRQQVLADIMWSIEEWSDVERFVATLPARERIECEGIVEMMRLELIDSYRRDLETEHQPQRSCKWDLLKTLKSTLWNGSHWVAALMKLTSTSKTM